MGRPSKLTPETQARILEAVELGATWERAADAAGVGASTLGLWRRRGEAGDAPYSSFIAALKAAESAGIERALRSIRSAAAAGAWQASAWLLERRYPADYGRRSEVAVQASASQAATATSDAAIIAALRSFAPSPPPP
jgi:hypothetical protein